MSSDDSDSERNTKVYKLKSRKNFQAWKQKTLSMASTRGLERFLLNDVPVDSEQEIEVKLNEYVNEADDDKRRKKKIVWSSAKKIRNKSLEAASMLTCSVRSKDLKMIAKCKNNPFKMFEVIGSRYGSNEDSDLTELLDDFDNCKLDDKKTDPEDWFADLEQINEQLGDIDQDFKKSTKELCSHVLKNLPKGYSGLKTMLQMADDHLQKYDDIKKSVSKHWKVNYRNKKSSKRRKKKKVELSESESSDSSSESESSSSSESSVHEKKKKKKNKKDKYALTITKGGDDYKNKHGTIVCGYCGKAGHAKVNCWELHGKPPKKDDNESKKSSGGGRACWICGSKDHISRNCPKRKDKESDDEDAEAQINAFFANVVITVSEDNEAGDATNESDGSNNSDNANQSKRCWCCKKGGHRAEDCPPLSVGLAQANNDNSNKKTKVEEVEMTQMNESKKARTLNKARGSLNENKSSDDDSSIDDDKVVILNDKLDKSSDDDDDSNEEKGQKGNELAGNDVNDGQKLKTDFKDAYELIEMKDAESEVIDTDSKSMNNDNSDISHIKMKWAHKLEREIYEEYEKTSNENVKAMININAKTTDDDEVTDRVTSKDENNASRKVKSDIDHIDRAKEKKWFKTHEKEIEKLKKVLSKSHDDKDHSSVETINGNKDCIKGEEEVNNDHIDDTDFHGLGLARANTNNDNSDSEYEKLSEKEVQHNIELYYKMLDRNFEKGDDQSNKISRVPSNSNNESDDSVMPLIKIFHNKKDDNVKLDAKDDGTFNDDGNIKHNKDGNSKGDSSIKLDKVMAKSTDDDKKSCNKNHDDVGLDAKKANDDEDTFKTPVKKKVINYEDIEFKNHAKKVKEGEVIYGQDVQGNRIEIPVGSVIYDRDPYQTDTDESHYSESDDEYEWDKLRQPTLEEFNLMLETGVFETPQMIDALTRPHTVNETKEEANDENESSQPSPSQQSENSIRSREPIAREATIAEARAFLAENLGHEAAMAEFPNSSEDEELVDVTWIDNMYANESKDMEDEESNEDENHLNVIIESIYEITHEDNDELWLADTGASCHVTYNEDNLTNLVESNNDRVIVGDKRKCQVTKKGDLLLTCNDGKDCIKLKEMRVVNEIGKNIISIGLLLKNGGTMSGTEDAIIIKFKEAKLKFKRDERDGLYYMRMTRTTPDESKYCYDLSKEEDEWKVIGKNSKPIDKSKWPKMSKKLAHEKWGHQHNDQLMKMANHMQIRLTGDLGTCAGCALVKSRAKANLKTTQEKAINKGQRLYIDTTGPYPASRGGMRYWVCAVDDLTDMTWTFFSKSKNKMTEFVTQLVVMINGLGNNVEYIRCDNAGEHQTKLQGYCHEEGITLEYTSPNTPQQNGRVEKKIHVLWQRAMTMMVQANFTKEAQTKFWAEAVSCSNYLENLTIKKGRDKPAIESWTGKSQKKLMKHLVQFGRVGVANDKGNKLKAKMNERGHVVMMVGYAANHASDTYRVFNPKTNRIVFSRDITWDSFKSKKLDDMLDVYSNDDSDSTFDDDSSISSEEYDFASEGETTETEETPIKKKRESQLKRMKAVVMNQVEATNLAVTMSLVVAMKNHLVIAQVTNKQTQLKMKTTPRPHLYQSL